MRKTLLLGVALLGITVGLMTTMSESDVLVAVDDIEQIDAVSLDTPDISVAAESFIANEDVFLALPPAIQALALHELPASTFALIPYRRSPDRVDR